MRETSPLAASVNPTRQSARLGWGTGAVLMLLLVGAGVGPLAHAGTTSVTSIAYDYDADGWLRKEMIEPGDSKLCLVTQHERDPYGHALTTTIRNCSAAAGLTAGSPVEAAPPTGAAAPAAFPARTSTFTYTTDQRFTATATNAVGHRQQFAYESGFGGVNSLTDPNLLVTTATYDSLGRKSLETSPDGTKVRWDYVYCSNAGVVIPIGAASATCATVGSVVPIFYTQVTPLKADGVTQLGRYTRVYFDEVNREIRTETQGYDGSGSTTLIYSDTIYNAQGYVKSKSRRYYPNEYPSRVSYHYDVLGRVTTEDRPTDTAASGAITTFNYNGLSVTTRDALGHATTQTLNVQGKIATTVDAKSGALSRTYDALGNLTATQDAQGNVIYVTYDKRGRKETLRDPDLGLTTSVYNAASDLVSQTDANTQTTTFTYDDIARVTSRAEPTQIDKWYYDSRSFSDGSTCSTAKGSLCEATTNRDGYSRRHYYDTLSRPTRVTTVSNGTYTASVTYDANSRIATRTYPSGLTINNVYTSGLGFLNQVVDGRTNQPMWTAVSMDAGDRLLQYSYGNSVTNSNDFFPFSGRLSGQYASTPGSTVQSLGYSYDAAGRLSSRLDRVTTVAASYGYDELNRLTSEARTGGSVSGTINTAWQYTAIGNVDSWTEAGVTKTYYYNTSGIGAVRPHAVVSVTGTVGGVPNPSYGYDNNGNLNAGAGRTLTWTSFDKVQTISQPSALGPKRLDYVYDAENQRFREGYFLNGVLQRTTVYLNPADGGGLFYEEETGVAGTKKKHYISAAGRAFAVITCGAADCTVPANTVTQYLHKDRLGSVSVVTNAAGGLVERFAYEPFGKRRNINGLADPNGALGGASVDRGYTEHEHMDEVGLINMNGRVFDPSLGRFMSADPTLPDPDDLQSFNRYSYVTNSPINFVDPSGFEDGAPGTEGNPVAVPGMTVHGNCCSSSGAGGGAGADNDDARLFARARALSLANITFTSKNTLGVVTVVSETKQAAANGLTAPGPSESLVGPAPQHAYLGPAFAPTPTPTPPAAPPAPTPAPIAPPVATSSQTPAPEVRSPIPVRGGGWVAALVTVLSIKGDTRATEPDGPPWVWVTYTRRNPATNQVYSGRSGGFGNPLQIVAARTAQQKILTGEGFLPGVLDKAASEDPRAGLGKQKVGAYNAIRGREQALIDFHGGAKSVGGTSRNAINGVSDINPMRPTYMNAAEALWGPLPDNSPDRFRWGD